MDEIKDIVKLTCAVCAQDGIISGVELDTAFRLINTSFNKISRNEISPIEKKRIILNKTVHPRIIISS